MPIATGLNDETEHFDLKTLPGGFVKLRRFTHGEKMYRKTLLGNAKIETETGNRATRRRGQRSQQANSHIELELANQRVTFYEFATSIVEHNLTYLVNRDDPTSEKLLDFKNEDHVSMLSGRVGEEIDDLITEINNYEVDDATGK